MSDNIASMKGAMLENYTQRVRPMIDLVDRLRRIGLDKELGLPSIVVVGDQSAGKSSVLEAISGIQLPRGSGMVTRCPLELRLKKNATSWKGKIEYTSNAGPTSNEILRPEDIEQKVREAQDKLTGENTGVSESLITLEVESPDLPDLTLIDLPGIVRVAMRNQPGNISGKIKDMIKNYISKQETIILAVIPANVDIETSEALDMAQKVDGDLSRTIGVITKTDTVQKGAEENLLAVLRNESFPLQKGYIAVKCRGQQAIKDNQSLKDALEEEEEFFANAEHFEDVPSETLGIASLSVRLTDELVAHIQRLLPKLREEVFKKRGEKQDELLKMGEGIPEDKTGRTRYLLKILGEYIEKLRQVDEGYETVDSGQDKNLQNLAREEFTAFSKTIKLCYNNKVSSKTFKSEIEKALERDRGCDLPRFFKFETFKNFVVKILREFSYPSLQCSDKVSVLVTHTLAYLAKHVFCRFALLKDKVLGLVSETVETAKLKTRKLIEESLLMEKLVFTQDETFNEILDACIKKQLESEQKESTYMYNTKREDTERQSVGLLKAGSDGRHQEAETMIVLTQAYMGIALKRISDQIPMIIRQQLIVNVITELKEKVMQLIEESSGALNTLKEERVSENKRARLQASLERLEKASLELLHYNTAV